MIVSRRLKRGETRWRPVGGRSWTITTEGSRRIMPGRRITTRRSRKNTWMLPAIPGSPSSPIRRNRDEFLRAHAVNHSWRGRKEWLVAPALVVAGMVVLAVLFVTEASRRGTARML